MGKEHARLYADLAAAGHIVFAGIYDVSASQAARIAAAAMGKKCPIARLPADSPTPASASTEAREAAYNRTAPMISGTFPDPPQTRSVTLDIVGRSVGKMGENVKSEP